jgi:hypothetical protein
MERWTLRHSNRKDLKSHVIQKEQIVVLNRGRT